jgi:hypothetical protein
MSPVLELKIWENKLCYTRRRRFNLKVQGKHANFFFKSQAKTARSPYFCLTFSMESNILNTAISHFGVWLKTVRRVTIYPAIVKPQAKGSLLHVGKAEN